MHSCASFSKNWRQGVNDDELEQYYTGGQWQKDFADDEAGKLPEELKRGVLSEDAVYDLITDHHETILRMNRIITKAIEGKML